MFPRVHYIVLFVLVPIVAPEKCKTPNNEKAECVSLYLCPILTSALATQQNASIEFVRRSNCGGTALNPMVCCGSVSTFKAPQNTEIKTEVRTINKESLLPARTYCGYQHADDYYHAENGTSIDEFPWLANLLYKTNEGTTTRCGGTLINSRYVLTAANCINFPFTFTGKVELIGVRLGEFNVKNETDCIGDNTDLYECTEPPQEFDIEKKIVHPRYDQGTRYANDIALLRLNKSVTYSDYIRPICLPTSGTRLAKPGDTLTTTGWGTTATKKYSETKKKILLKLMTNEECVASTKQFEKVLTQNQFCTSSLETNTQFACHGDAGNPIMFSTRSQWNQEGISSFGANHCPSNIPDVHTKVVNYMDWIKENIEP